MSRSSSGCESSHLPSPENPSLPFSLPLTHPSKTTLQTRSENQASTLPSLIVPMTSYNLRPEWGQSHHRDTHIATLRLRSWSCEELWLGGRPSPTVLGLLRPCLSLGELHSDLSLHTTEHTLEDPEPAHTTTSKAGVQGEPTQEALPHLPRHSEGPYPPSQPLLNTPCSVMSCMLVEHRSSQVNTP